MKLRTGKLFFWVIVAFLVGVLGCVNQRATDPEAHDPWLQSERIGNQQVWMAQKDLLGIEIWVDQSGDKLQHDPKYLSIVKPVEDGWVFALSAPGGKQIEKGERLLWLEEEEDLPWEVLQAIPVEEASWLSKRVPAGNIPDGLNLIDLDIETGKSGVIRVHVKAPNYIPPPSIWFADVTGIELYFELPSQYLQLDDEGGTANPVELVGDMAKGLAILDYDTQGSLIRVSVSLMEPMTIQHNYAQDWIRIKVKAIDTPPGEQTLAKIVHTEQYASVLMDKDFERHPFPAYGDGRIFFNYKPQLLGDFNNTREVGILDFIDFAEHYLSVKGDARYNDIYDIGPAEMKYGLEWTEIFDLPLPDGKIDLKDFVVFANNYRKKHPSRPIPSIEIDTPLTDSEFTQSKVIVQGKVINVEGVNQVRLSLNGRLVDVPLVEEENHHSFSHWVELEEQFNRIRVSVVDTHGIEYSKEITVKFEYKKPVVHIDKPLNNAEFSVSQVEIQGRVEHFNNQPIQVTINQTVRTVPVTDGQFSLQAMLTAGQNRIRAVARDERGTEGTAEVFVTYDPDTPQPEEDALRIELTWNRGLADLDLYVKEPGDDGQWVWFGNMQGEGRLLWNDRDGYGPERYILPIIDDYEGGEFQVRVHYRSTNGQTLPVTARVVVRDLKNSRDLLDEHFVLEEANMENTHPEAQGPDWWDVGRFEFPQ